MFSVATSTAVERAFRSLTGWTNREGQGLPTIAAKHVYASFKVAAARWRKRCGRTSASGLGRLRPAWVKTHNRGFKGTGYHLFCQGKPGTSVWSGARREWMEITRDVRAKCNARAQHMRDTAKAGASPLEQFLTDATAPDVEDGPWQLSSLNSPFCVRSDVVRRFVEHSTFPTG